ncbi:putative signal recognition particle srp9 subunit [Diplodia seriata]|uniref:Putative signal recognition particle srp9 subunit n=1 Tax=Diplodia seriata TaxID=420778 RepID=A0A0G2ER12_9PEZI|nr:putative signal recognition particle srp9 subunit [Diplodia seriata]
MPYFTTSAEWFEQSRLLLEACPTTARIVTKYSIIKRKTTKDGKRQVATSDSAHADATQLKPPAPGAPAQAPAPTQAALTLKTYDPVSGVCLKYQTTKAAEVGRLIASLERLARAMAALPSVQEDAAMPDAPAVEQGTGTNTPNPEPAKADSKPAQGGGKKKKKGKK